jgi:hypothetical protein
MRAWIIPALCVLVLMATCTMARADNNPFSGARSFEISLTKETRNDRPKSRKVYRPQRSKAGSTKPQ